MLGPALDAVRKEQVEIAPAKRIQGFAMARCPSRWSGEFAPAGFKYFSGAATVRWQYGLLETWLPATIHSRSASRASLEPGSKGVVELGRIRRPGAALMSGRLTLS
jgi:hypothetical protein